MGIMETETTIMDFIGVILGIMEKKNGNYYTKLYRVGFRECSDTNKAWAWKQPLH